MQKCEVLVVGGGPAGATAARYLAKAGLFTVLVQRNFDFKKPCGGCIRLDAFEEFDLDSGIIHQHIKQVDLSFKQQTISLDISKTPLVVVDRKPFDQYLRSLAQKHGAVVIEARYNSFEKHEDGYIVKIKRNAGYEYIQTKNIIAADGVNSKIRSQVFNSSVSSLLTNYTDVPSKPSDICNFYFGKSIASKYYAWSFPEPCGLDIGTLADDRQIPYMKNLLDYLSITTKTKISGYKIPHYNKAVFNKDTIFFVGDSAEQVLPFTYEGIYYAMSSAKILAEVIATEQSPETYEQRWNAVYLKKFETLKKLQKIFLYNDFMINIMMKLYENDAVKRHMIQLWLGKYSLEINFGFFIRVVKKLKDHTKT